jgi:hypothetical protein
VSVGVEKGEGGLYSLGMILGLQLQGGGPH